MIGATFIFKRLQSVCHKILGSSNGQSNELAADFKQIRELLSLPPVSTNGPKLPRSVCWLIPNPNTGSGGHMNLFRFANLLENRGYHCHFCVRRHWNANYQESPSQLGERVSREFIPLKASWQIGFGEVPESAFYVATSWDTAYVVNAILSENAKKVYFIQDLESLFYETGSLSAAVNLTYRMGFTGITDGNWLSEKLRADYQMDAHSFHFSANEEVFFPGPLVAENSILFYARPSTSRRGFAFGAAVLEELHRIYPNFHVITVGSDLPANAFTFEHENLGIVSSQILGQAARRSKVALILSFTNASLLPLECMACGCPVISNNGANVEWLLNDENSILCDADVNQMAWRIKRYFELDEYEEKRSRALAHVASLPSWQQTMGEVIERVFH